MRLLPREQNEEEGRTDLERLSEEDVVVRTELGLYKRKEEEKSVSVTSGAIVCKESDAPKMRSHSWYHDSKSMLAWWSLLSVSGPTTSSSGKLYSWR